MAYLTFPAILPDSDAGTDKKPDYLSAPFGDKYTQIAGNGINPFDESWNLIFTKRDKAEIKTITDFLDALMLATDKFFYWTPPDETPLTPNPKKWMLDDTGYKKSNAGADLRNCSFKITRVFAA